MNTLDILQYGHQHVLDSLKGLARLEWETPGVCGIWSVKDVLAHLASFEFFRILAVRQLLEPSIPNPTIIAMLADEITFNDSEVERRQQWSAERTLADYVEASDKTAEFLPHLPPMLLQQNGTLPWYGKAYSLNDFIVYTNYGHKREHVAQVKRFRTMLRQQAPALSF